VSHTMTCWKEVAQFLGKGVRTVQRWEHEIGLPVHRPNGTRRGVILAYSDEIEAWAQSPGEDQSHSELGGLQKELAELREQNALLRAELKRAQLVATFFQPNGSYDVDDDLFRRRCSAAVQRNNAIRRKFLHLVDVARDLARLPKDAT